MVHRAVALPPASGMRPPTATIFSVFGWFVRCFQDSFSPLPFYALTLSPVFSSLFLRVARNFFFVFFPCACAKPVYNDSGAGRVNGAVPGSIIRRTVALPTATIMRPPTATIISVFGWFVRCFQHSSTCQNWPEGFGRAYARRVQTCSGEEGNDLQK